MQLPEVLGGTSLSRKAPVKIIIDTIWFQAVLDNLEAFIKQWQVVSLRILKCVGILRHVIRDSCSLGGYRMGSGHCWDRDSCSLLWRYEHLRHRQGRLRLFIAENLACWNCSLYGCLGASSVYSISIAEFKHIGSSLSHRSGTRFGDAASVFDFLVPGSSLSWRAFMRLRLSAFGC